MKTKLAGFCLLSFLLVLSFSLRLNAQAVVANFSSTPTSGCAPLNVSFVDLSSGLPTSWSWNFGNTNTSSSQNPGAVYSIPGTYTVTLVASKAGSSSTKTSTITVFANPVANFNINASPSCVGQTITFTDSSTPGSGTIISWTWDFGDGNVITTPTGTTTHSYASTGTFPVSVIVTDNNGCVNSIIKSVTIIASPVAAFTGTPLFSCTAPMLVNFTNNSTGAGLTYSWTFGDGSPASTATAPSHTYTAPGTYTVKLVVTQGACKDSLTRTSYIVIQSIAANFTANNTSACEGSTIGFTETSAPLSSSRIWDFGDGSPTSTLNNPSHLYTTPGTYTVTLTATDASGCTDAEIKTNYITIHPKPVVAFTADNTISCSAPFTVNFTDQSTNNASWVWNFGDGSPTSSSQNPSHTYTANGTYTVTLTVTSVNGCTSTLVKNNYILISPPVADFAATPREGCAPLLVNFTSTSTSLADPITSYFWDFGNGTATTLIPTTTNTYPIGVYPVTLVITTATGCKDTVTKLNYIKAGLTPTANFNVVDSTVCYGLNAQFNNLSVGADSAFWQWGDGGTLSSLLPAANPVNHFYADTGTYIVTLIVYDRGCADTLILTNIVRILPVKPIFTRQLNCINPYSVTFMDASLGADSLSWDFGDGSPLVADLLNPTHVYATRGSKTVTLTAFNFTTGCFFSTSLTFTIADPIAQFTPPAPIKGCYPFSVVFNSSTSQDATGTPAKSWNFGDGSPTSTTANPTHVFTLPGSYTVRLIITDLNGCKDTTTKLVIAQGPTPNFTSNVVSGCVPLLVNFTDTSISDSTLTSWTWNFGDGNTSTVATPITSHTYTVSGTYSVSMTVTDKNGCTKTATKLTYIQATFPVPSFLIVPDSFACMNEPLTFNASGTSASLPATYSWRFGDGTPLTAPTTVATAPHSYATQNTFTVTLIVTDKNGCVDSIKKQVLVQHPTVAFDTTMLAPPTCGNLQIQFNNLSTGPGGPFTYSWDFGDGAGSFIANPSKTYTQPGTYTVTLTVTNNAGCTSSQLVDTLIVVPGPVGTFTFTPTSGCRPLTVTFTATSNNSTSYTWDFGDGTVIPNTTSNTITHTYTKDGTPMPILLLGDTLSDGTFCEAPAPSAGVVTIVTSVLVDIDSTIIILDENETVILISDTSGFSSSPTYSWTPSTGLSCTDCLEPLVTGDGSGITITYVLTVTDAGGCIGDDSVIIIFPLCKNDDFQVPNVFTPNGDLTNDLFDVHGLCKRNTYLIRIYNRWGIEVFSANERNNSWDGRISSGMPAAEGVYYYIITLDEKRYTGFLHLIR